MRNPARHRTHAKQERPRTIRNPLFGEEYPGASWIQARAEQTMGGISIASFFILDVVNGQDPYRASAEYRLYGERADPWISDPRRARGKVCPRVVEGGLIFDKSSLLPLR